jgi:hypothetical protein
MFFPEKVEKLVNDWASENNVRLTGNVSMCQVGTSSDPVLLISVTYEEDSTT